jgi:mevalonate kinase
LDDSRPLSDEEVDGGGITFYQSQSFAGGFDSNNFCDNSPVQTCDMPSAAQPKELPPNLVALFQEQQAMFQKIVKQQENMLRQQEQLIEKQKVSEEKILHIEESLNASCSSKLKTRVTRQLTVGFFFSQSASKP